MSAKTSISLQDLRFERRPTGLGVSTPSPRLSWRFASLAGDGQASINQGRYQSAYEIEIKRPNRTERIWKYKFQSSNNTFVPWPDAPLQLRERVSVRVRAFGATASEDHPPEPTEWTPWKILEAALLSSQDWIAAPMTFPECSDRTKIRPIRLRKVFRIPQLGKQLHGRLYISALGIYEAYLNGHRIGDEHFAPGWTSFHHRLQYQLHDVTHLLNGQENTIAIEVASGPYAGRLLWNDEHKFAFYGNRIAAFAQLEIRTEDQQMPDFVLATDDTLESSLSSILPSSIYDGEELSLVEALPLPETKLVADSFAPVKITQTIRPTRIFTSPKGKTLVDFRQNLVGTVHIPRLSCPNGHILRIRHAEVLERGELGTRPLRTAQATDTIIFGGNRCLENWSPHFTYHGFRYVEIEGWTIDDDTEPLTLDAISALVMHSDLLSTGHFECSNDSINQLHQNVVWSIRGNMFSIPTDCPQCDERLGWTGDIQVFCPTAAFIFDVNGLLSNWMRDLVTDQMADGGIVPLVVPDVRIPWPSVPQAIWDDVVVILPWTIYTWYGDKSILEDNYAGMQGYLNKSLRRGPDGLWDPSLWQLGDWLDPGAPPHDPGLSRTNGTLVADEYLVYVTRLMCKISRVIERTEDAASYEKQLDTLERVFQAKYMAPSGLLVGDTQTALALSLAFFLHPQDEPEKRQAAACRLAELVRYAQFRVSTGFAGTPQILFALSESGNLQLAYRMLLEEECPSWLYPVRMGATSIWERWDSMLENETINPGEMTSFNHYALGSVATWLHAVVGGLFPLEPRWKRFKVHPRPGGDVRSAKISYLGSCGQIRCSWELSSQEGVEKFRLRLEVPGNSTAEVVLTDGTQINVGSGVYSFESYYVPEGEWPPTPLRTAFRD
ncbi:alfa-L-rhamnosidase [Fusarium solani]|uniref:alpha-L-rhamnosidase n=1 Tax=Fusarium solani TaxID=169388 RepID=A0A9P9KTB1_FUSSL|nr:alfa-L-rhamnosidase [Fusarium solani]KAH7268008.1 alfa-L-rhamnosidase [Fusarium solani]